MEIFINKWGNSLGLRLPKYIVDKYDLSSKSKLILTESDDGIILKKPKKITLSEIIESYPDNYKTEADSFSDNLPSEDWEWSE